MFRKGDILPVLRPLCRQEKSKDQQPSLPIPGEKRTRIEIGMGEGIGIKIGKDNVLHRMEDERRKRRGNRLFYVEKVLEKRMSSKKGGRDVCVCEGGVRLGDSLGVQPYPQ